MSDRFAPPLHLAIKHSPSLLLGLAVLHLLAALACFGNSLPVSYQSVLLLVTCISFVVSLKRHCLTPPLRTLVFDATGSWLLGLQSGETVPARLLGSSVSSPVVTVLHFEIERWRRRSLVLFRDSLAPGNYRLLRVALKTRVALTPR